MNMHVPESRNQEFAGAIQNPRVFNGDFLPHRRDGAVRQQNSNISLNLAILDIDDRDMLDGDWFRNRQGQGKSGGKSKHGPRVAPTVSEGNGTRRGARMSKRAAFWPLTGGLPFAL